MNDRSIELNIPDADQWVFVPYRFIGRTIGGKKIPFAMLFFESMVYSLSNAEAQRQCRQSYSEICARLAVCNDTVARSVKALSMSGAVTQDKSRKVCASYVHTELSRELEGIEIPRFLSTTEFYIRGKRKRDGTVIPPAVRKLRRGAQLILCEFIRAANGGADLYATSDSRLAKKFYINKSTVSDYISELLRADLVFRPKERRGCNGTRLSTYVVNKKLLHVAHKKAVKLLKKERRNSYDASNPSKSFDERVERERWYAIRRQVAENRAQWYNDRAEQDPAYHAAKAKVRALDIEIVKAEVFHLPGIVEMKRRRFTQCAICAERLAALHIKQEDLLPPYHCKKCNDTGYDIRTGHLCDCYSPHSSPPTRNKGEQGKTRENKGN